MNLDTNSKAKIVLLGIPYDENYSYLKGASKGPAEIRSALKSDSANLYTEELLNLGTPDLFFDGGDIAGSNFPEDIVTEMDKVIARGYTPITLGGDHSITYPVIKSISSRHKKLTILHLDAHGDLYDEFQGSKYSHACPFARIMEEGLATRLVQVGIRTLTQHQREQADRFGVEIIEMKDFSFKCIPDLNSPLYLSLDLDVLDPAFAPGISHYEPGGMSTREVIHIIQSLKTRLIGADIVELNPDKDVNSMTAMVAAKLLKEILNNMLAN